MKRDCDTVMISTINAMTTLSANKLETGEKKPALGFFRVQPFLFRQQPPLRCW